MFLDRTFRPQQNKVAIEPNRSLWLSLRREMDNERIFTAYDNWLLECNKKYDHEVSFDTDPAHVAYDEDRGMTRHKCILLAGTKFKVGDKIKIQKKGTKVCCSKDQTMVMHIPVKMMLCLWVLMWHRL